MPNPTTAAAHVHVANPANDLLDWERIEDVVLDMDGTLIDLNYDNRVWNELVPQHYAAARGITVGAAREDLVGHMAEIRGSIEFYSFDYWDSYTGLDMESIHREATEMIQYRPGVPEFLAWVKATGRRSIIATNAHRTSLVVKSTMIDIAADVDAVVSSHDYGVPKEDQSFWEALAVATGMAPSRSVFIDDNEPVLDAARSADVAQLLCVDTPDSARPARVDLRYPSFDDFRDLYAD